MTFERYLTEDEEKRFLRVMSEKRCLWARRDHAVAVLLRATGIRIGSACGLTVGAARAALREDHQLMLDPAHAKRGRGYSVTAAKRARQALRALLAIRRELGLADNSDAPLLVSRQTATSGQGMTPRAIQKRFAYWRQQAGITGVSPHWMRHTLAQRVMRQSTARDPRGVVQSMLGHGSASSTAIYTQPTKEDVAAAFEEVA